MSTNVYAYKRKPVMPWGELEKACKDHNLESLHDVLEKFHQEESMARIHIGKRSGGWKFLFNHNNWVYYSYTRESIDAFLRSCELIENEYGEPVTVEEFWKDYVEDFADGFNGRQYEEEQLKKAYAKEAGKLEDKYGWIPSISQAESNMSLAQSHNFYEEKFCCINDQYVEIPYDQLQYRFSNSTDFC